MSPENNEFEHYSAAQMREDANQLLGVSTLCILYGAMATQIFNHSHWVLEAAFDSAGYTSMLLGGGGIVLGGIRRAQAALQQE